MTIPKTLAGRVAVVTGAGSGLGRGIAARLGSAGADLAILEIDPASGAEAAAEIAELGVRTRSYEVDVADSNQVNATVERLVTDFGAVDILVNNAGISRIGPHTQDVTDEEWLDCLGVMQSGVFYCMRAAGRVMIAQGRGAIVNISSIRGFSPIPGRMTYAPAKAAVIMMTKIAAGEWAQHGVRVNAVAPGFCRTQMHDDQVASGAFAEEHYLRTIPAGRFGTPEEVGAMVAYLASDDASYVTGACFVIDGGLTTIPGG